MWRIIAVFWLLSAMFLPLPGMAAAGNATGNTFSFRHITDRNGLPFTWIYDISQDSAGYMWFSTVFGAFRYDGYDFFPVSFPERDNDRILSVRAVTEDSLGYLWFLTEDGMYRYDYVHDVFTGYSSREEHPGRRLLSDNVLCMAEVSGGLLYVGTYAGIEVVDADSGHVIHDRPDIHEGISDIVVRKDGTVYAGSITGNVYVLDGSGTVSASFPVSPGRTVTDLCEDSSSMIWAATEGNGVFVLSDTAVLERFTAAEGTLTDDIARTVARDANGYMWAGTEQGITVFKEGRIEFIRRSDNPWGLNDNAVYSIFMDRDRNIWVGTFFGGINFLDSGRGMFSGPVTTDGVDDLKGCAVSAIVPFDGHVFIGTENRGFFLYDGKSGSMRNCSSADCRIGNDNVHAICADRYGNIFIGNYHGGLSVRFAGDDMFSPVDMAGVPSNSIYSIFADSEGNVWVGTYFNGLFRYDYASGRLVKQTSVPGSIFVWDIMESRTGDIWLAGFMDGLLYLDKSRGYSPVSIDTGADGYVTLCELSDGTILAGTEKEGLTVVDPEDGSAVHISRKDGLPDNTIYGILQDRYGNIWFSTNSGIYRTDRAMDSFIGWSVEDGLPVNRFNYNACSIIDGKLWFGSVDGLVCIDPSRIVTGNVIHPVRFNDFWLNGKRLDVSPDGILPEEINSAGTVRLAGRHFSWGVDFTCNVFGDNSVRFAYRLDGMDGKWYFLEETNKIEFTGLDYGKYRLDVSTVGPGGHISPDMASVNVAVVPPWWASPYAFALYSMAVLLVAGWMVWLLMKNYRIKYAYRFEKLSREKENEVNEMKLRFFMDISHEFRTPLSLIIGPVSSIIEKTVPHGQEERYFNIIRKNAEKLLGLINELLAFRELDSMKLEIERFLYMPFLSAACDRYRWLFESKSIKVQLFPEDADQHVFADIDKLEKIIDNLLSNAYKYTPIGGEVRISVRSGDGRLYTEVANTGQGISPETLPHVFDRFFRGRMYDAYSSGVGLSYVRSLVRLHHGDIHAESEPGSWTRFVFWLPMTYDGTEVKYVDAADWCSRHFPDLSLPAGEPDSGGFGDKDYLETEKETVVLVAEDEADMRNLTVNALSPYFTVEAAADVGTAWSLVKEKRVDILVTDVMLGDGMNGFDLCSMIRRNEEASHIHIVMMSVLSEDEYKERAYMAGVDAYIVKPFKPSMLVRRIRNLVHNIWKTRLKYRIDIDLSNVELTASGSDKEWIQMAVSKVFDHMSDTGFGPDEFCAAMGMSQSTLYRRLKTICGQSPNEFIQNIRLKYAARLLRETSMTVSEISYDTGFSDSSYFSRAFKKCFGLSPKQWRNGSQG